MAFVLRLIFLYPIHITLRGKNAPIYIKEFSLKDGGHIDTRTTTTDELSRDFEEQSAAAKRNRYAFITRVSILCLHFLISSARESNRMDCLSVFDRQKTLHVFHYSHIAFLFLSLSNRKTTTTTEKNGVRTARVYITIRTTTTDDEDNDGFGGGADSWEKDANDADEE